MFSLSSQVTAGACAIPFAFFAWRFCGNFLNEFFIRKSTVLKELEHIGEARPDGKRVKGTAVICGGSIAGLWTARLVADHFEDVLIIEPEAWLGTRLGISNTYNAEGERIEQETLQRTRVAQYNISLHVFQPLAYWALKKLFPDFDEEVKNASGRIQEYEVNAYVFGRQVLRLSSLESSPRCFWLSREAYERILRRLVLGSSRRIRWLTGTAVGVHTSPNDLSVLSAVTVRLPDGTKQDVPASLVIDCTGATEAGVKWLRRIASERVDDEQLRELMPSNALPWEKLRITYDVHVRFIIFRFYVPPEARNSLPIPGGYEKNVWPYTYTPIPGKEHKFFMVNRIEGHRVNMMFIGWGNPELPESLDDVVDWMKKFEVDHAPIPKWIYTLFDTLLKYRDQCEVLLSRYPDQCWTFWESAPYIPSNFIAIGDSVMRVNPTFGQGCSKAAIGAMTLDGMLRERSLANSTSIPPAFGRRFFKTHRDKIEGIRDGTKPMDCMFPTTTPVQGEKLSDERLKGVLGNLMIELAGLDDEVDAELFKVRFFLGPPERLLRPRLLLKYAVFALRKQLGLVPAIY